MLRLKIKKRIPNSNWVWLDIFMGFIFIEKTGNDPYTSWDGAELWTKILSLWEPWFK